jgi:hypothetical protein
MYEKPTLSLAEQMIAGSLRRDSLASEMNCKR